MSLDLAFGIARSGLAATQRALAQTSQNLINAETPGHTRKSTEPQAVSVGGLPLGVRLGEARRGVDQALVIHHPREVIGADVRPVILHREVHVHHDALRADLFVRMDAEARLQLKAADEDMAKARRGGHSPAARRHSQ